MFRQPTGTEQLINQALAKTFGDVTIRCLSQADLAKVRGEQPDPNGYSVRGFANPGIPIVWMDAERCDALAEYANDPIDPRDVKVSDGAKKIALDRAGDAAVDVAHEVSPVFNDEPLNKFVGGFDESGANCFAGHTADELLVALGATPSAELTSSVAEAAMARASEGARLMDPAYALSADCRQELTEMVVEMPEQPSVTLG